LEFLNLKCDFCESIDIYYDPLETFNNYTSDNFEITEIKTIINNPHNDYLVFRCRVCGAVIKYTFKDIEKNIKEYMYEIIVNLIAMKQFKNISSVEYTKKVFVYCGKCKGWNGKGSCPVEIFDKCRLKKIPRL
jgi:hypothetical protein